MLDRREYAEPEDTGEGKANAVDDLTTPVTKQAAESTDTEAQVVRPEMYQGKVSLNQTEQLISGGLLN